MYYMDTSLRHYNRLSHLLLNLLHRKRNNNKLHMDTNGYVDVHTLLGLRVCKDYTLDDVFGMIETNNIFEMQNDENDGIYIRVAAYT